MADHQDRVDQSRPYQYLADLKASDSREGYSDWRCYLGDDYSSAFSCVLCGHHATFTIIFALPSDSMAITLPTAILYCSKVGLVTACPLIEPLSLTGIMY